MHAVVAELSSGHAGAAALCADRVARARERMGEIGIDVLLLSVGAERRLIHAAQVAVPDRELTLRAATRVLARTITLLRGAAAHLFCGKPLPAPFAARRRRLTAVIR